jgi:hypothetical protein
MLPVTCGVKSFNTEIKAGGRLVRKSNAGRPPRETPWLDHTGRESQPHYFCASWVSVRGRSTVDAPLLTVDELFAGDVFNFVQIA